MNTDRDMDDTAWVKLAIFYVRLPRLDGDPPAVQFRAEVLYGEGQIVADGGKQKLLTENLGEGIYVLHVTNTLGEIAARLSEPSFEYRFGRGPTSSVGLITFGLRRRPPVVGVSGRDGWIHSPVDRPHRIHQFVRVEKAALLQRIVESVGGDEGKRSTANRILDALSQVAGLNLRSEHIQWLGDVIVVERVRSVAWWNAAKTENSGSCQAIDVHVQPDTAGLIQVQARVSGLDEMCLCDRLLEWRDGGRAPQRIEVSEEVGSVMLRAWVAGGLVMEQQYALFRGFGARIDLVGATYTIRDRLTAKLEGALKSSGTSRDLLAAAERVSSTAMSTRAGSSMDGEPWQDLNNTPQAVLDFLSPPYPDYSFFPANPIGRAQAVLHFAKLIATSRDAYLVDPWFDAEGAKALLPRVQGEVHLTVVTNLPSHDHREQRMKLVDYLRDASTMGLPPSLKIVCTHRKDAANQAFHDRFLLVRDDSQWRGFVLTNSFSGFATRFPLFVVEAPLATTALLLDEMERLLEPPAFEHEQLWPPPPTPPSGEPERRGDFPYWRVLLEGLVPRNGRNESQWLAAAQAAGVLIVTDDEIKWHMSDSARASALTWLIGPERRRRPARDWRSAPRRARHRWNAPSRRRPFDVGRSVMVLGELAARGLKVDALTVSSALRQHRAFAIERVLRQSFRDDPDPTRLKAGVPVERLGLRQILRSEVPLPQAVVAGFGLWNANFWELGRDPSWGRHFAYAVLFHLDPARAVRMCERLLDVDFLMPLVHALVRDVTKWTEPLSRALLQARSPTLRAYGAQSLVQRSFSRPRNQAVARPSDVNTAVSVLRSVGVTAEELAYYLAAWGAYGDQRDGAGCAAIATALVLQLDEVDAAVRDGVVDFVLKRDLPGRNFLESFVQALERHPGAGVAAVLERVVRTFAARFRSSESADLYFHRSSDVKTALIIASAAKELASRRGTSPATEIREAADLERIQREGARLTPLRWRTHSRRADVAFGWIVLMEVMASATAFATTGATLPSETSALARRYLSAPRVGLSKEVRAVIGQLLDGTTPESDDQDDDEEE